MNIAICDDDINIINTLEELVASCFNDDATRHNCEEFSNAESLMRRIEKEPNFFQIYILDIRMAKMNGLEAAAEIRKNDIDSEIIFVTSHGEKMQEAFDVQAFHYLIKPLDIDKTRQVILRCIHRIEEKQSVFSFQSRQTPYSLYYSQIEYFESDVRKIIINLTDDTTRTFYDRLDLLEQNLPLTQFARIHKSYIVNMDQVETMTKNGVWMHSGKVLPVSRKYHQHFNELYRNYLLRRRG